MGNSFAKIREAAAPHKLHFEIVTAK